MKKYRELTHQDIEIVQQEDVYEGFFKIRQYQLKQHLYAGGWTGTFERECMIRSDAVGVLLYDPQRHCVLLGSQFRIGALGDESPWILECVAGLIEPGETLEQVAHRESEEEMGAQITRLISLYDYYPTAGSSTERVFLFCGIVDSEGLEGVYGLAEEHEDIAVSAYSLDQVKQLLASNKIKNANAIIALQWLLMNYTGLS